MSDSEFFIPMIANNSSRAEQLEETNTKNPHFIPTVLLVVSVIFN